MESEERYKILLKAAYDLLKKQDGSFYVLNLLEETVVYGRFFFFLLISLFSNNAYTVLFLA